MRHVLSILVDDRFGELPRVVGLLAGRGFPLDAVTAAPSDGSTMRIHVATRGEATAVERVRRLLAGQIRVREAARLTETSSLEREMALVTVRFHEGTTLDDVWTLARRHNGRIVDAVTGAATVEASGAPEVVEAFVEAVARLGECEVARTGPLAVRKLASEPKREAAEPRRHLELVGNREPASTTDYCTGWCGDSTDTAPKAKGQAN